MREQVDDLLAQVPEGWDFWMGSFWRDDGTEGYEVRLQQRALGEFLHLGHYRTEIEKTAPTLREAFDAALREIL